MVRTSSSRDEGIEEQQDDAHHLALDDAEVILGGDWCHVR
jgi:hypothetical protein